jgi:pimeloyl-ACP methyl ester carboxylesterase
MSWRRGLGERPIAFVCHSLGGLLAKQLLRIAGEDAAQPAWRKIAGQTKGVVFVATPHAGADLARTLRRLGWVLRTSPAIDDLRAHAPALRELNEWYRGYAVRPRGPVPLLLRDLQDRRDPL